MNECATATPSSMLTPAAIARQVGVSKRTVLRWIERGDLPAFRIGSVTRIELTEFERFLARHRAQSRNGEHSVEPLLPVVSEQPENFITIDHSGAQSFVDRPCERKVLDGFVE